MQETKYRRLTRFVLSLVAFALIFYGAYSGNAELVRRFAIEGAQAACQQRSGAERLNLRDECTAEDAIVLEAAVFDGRMAKAHNPLTLTLIAIGCLVVVSVANLLMG